MPEPLHSKVAVVRIVRSARCTRCIAGPKAMARGLLSTGGGNRGVGLKPRQQKIIRERRQYNQWVASQTLEDYALRFTAQSARKSTARVGNTALGPIAF